MNRKTRREMNSLGEKGESKEASRLYIPAKTTNSRSYEGVVPGSSDGQHHEYRRTCKQRWGVMVLAGNAAGVKIVEFKTFRKRRDALRRRHLKSDTPKLVTT